jgi:hypothetical protein
MAQIISFPLRPPQPEDFEVDLLTAVDAAIRDLRDISQASEQDQVRQRADECRAMLERAFRVSVA